jgi:hypothetical protein
MLGFEVLLFFFLVSRSCFSVIVDSTVLFLLASCIVEFA